MSFGGLNLLQLFVPPALQLAGYQTIAGVHRVVLFKRLLSLVLELLQLAGQGGALRHISGPQFRNGLQTGFHPERRDHLEQLLTQSAIDRSTAKAQAILAAIVIVSFAEITRVGAPASPVADVQLATTMPTPEKPHQQPLSGTNRRHGFVAFPVHGITLDHASVLFVGGPVNITHVMMGDKDPAIFSATKAALTFLQSPFHQQGRHGTTAPNIGAGIEGINENIADQTLGRNLPDELSPLERVGRELQIVIAKPLEGLAHAPPFAKFHKDELNGFANPSIGMKDNLAQGVSHIAHRKALEQFPPARFAFLARLEPLPKNLQFYNAERPLNAQDQLIIEIVQVVDLLLVGDQGSKNLAHFQQPAPVFVRARQPRDLPAAHDSHLP